MPELWDPCPSSYHLASLLCDAFQATEVMCLFTYYWMLTKKVGVMHHQKYLAGEYIIDWKICVNILYSIFKISE